jgi:hypothetical protein
VSAQTGIDNEFQDVTLGVQHTLAGNCAAMLSHDDAVVPNARTAANAPLPVLGRSWNEPHVPAVGQTPKVE